MVKTKDKRQSESMIEAGKKWKKRKHKEKKAKKLRRLFIKNLIKPSTLRSYSSIWKSMKEFLDGAGESIMTKDTFTAILGTLHEAGKSASLVTAYKSALAFAQKYQEPWAGSNEWLASVEMQDV